VHRLILRGGAGKIIDEEGNGINFNDKTNSLPSLQQPSLSSDIKSYL
jgi:hypothetical protein